MLSINLGNDNAGLYAALYFYNDGGPELIDKSEIGQDGTAQLRFSQASDYLIVIGEKSDNDVEKTDNSGEPSEIVPPESNDKTPPPAKPDTEDTEENNPKTGEPWQPWRIMLIGSMAAIIGSILSRRKKTETK